MLENNSQLTSRKIVEEFGIYHTTVGDHIRFIGLLLHGRVCCLDWDWTAISDGDFFGIIRIYELF